MIRRMRGVCRNLILLYLGIFMVMAAWGATGPMLDRLIRPAVANTAPRRGGPTLLELLGIWDPVRNLWQRLLELGLPGPGPNPGRLTALPAAVLSSVSPASFWRFCS